MTHMQQVMSKQYDEILFLTIIFIATVIINIIIVILIIMKRHCCYLTVSGLDEKSLFTLLDLFLAFILPIYRIYRTKSGWWQVQTSALLLQHTSTISGANTRCNVKPSVRYLHIYVCLAKIQQPSQAFYLKQNSQ